MQSVYCVNAYLFLPRHGALPRNAPRISFKTYTIASSVGSSKTRSALTQPKAKAMMQQLIYLNLQERTQHSTRYNVHTTYYILPQSPK